MKHNDLKTLPTFELKELQEKTLFEFHEAFENKNHDLHYEHIKKLLAINDELISRGDSEKEIKMLKACQQGLEYMKANHPTRKKPSV